MRPQAQQAEESNVAGRGGEGLTPTRGQTKCPTGRVEIRKLMRDPTLPIV